MTFFLRRCKSRMSEVDRLDNQIKDQVEHLEQLLNKKRAKEDDHISLWPSCAAAGEGYVGCRMGVPGHCPPESEFKTTFRGTPFANAYAKNMDTDEMERCVPAYLVGKPTAERKRQERQKMPFQERLLRAVMTIENNFEPLQEASSFQWNTPCDQAVSREQCEILRDAPKYDSSGHLQYADHNTRCSWRPTEDATEYWKQVEANETPQACVPREDSNFTYKPLTTADLEDIKEAVGKAKIGGRIAADKQEAIQRYKDDIIKDGSDFTLETPYGTRRQRITTDPRALTEALVHLPLLPTKSTLNYLQTYEDLKDITGFKDLTSYVYVDPSPYTGKDLESTDAQTFDKSKTDARAALRELHKHHKDTLLPKLEKMCDNTDVKYVWGENKYIDGLDSNAKTNTWMHSFLVPSEEDHEDQPYLEKLKKQIKKYAASSWWKFASQATGMQANFIDQFKYLKRAISRALENKKTREELELSLNDVVEVQDRDKVVIDASFLWPLRDVLEGNTKLGVDTKKDNILGDATNPNAKAHHVVLQMKDGGVAGGGAVPIRGAGGSRDTLRAQLSKEPLFKFSGFDGLTDDDDIKNRAEQVGLAIARILALASVKDLTNDTGANNLRALHRRGLSKQFKWRTPVQNKVYVAYVKDSGTHNEKEYHQKVLESIKRLERLRVADEVKRALVSEKAKHGQNLLILKYFESLNTEQDPESRYRIAISQIPKLLKYKMDQKDVVKHTAAEIKRRFRRQPGHALYYNRLVNDKKAGTDAAYDLAVQAGGGTTASSTNKVTQQFYAAARYVTQVNDQLEKIKQEEADDAAAVDKLSNFIKNFRKELRGQLKEGRVPEQINMNRARDFEERFGHHSYVDPFAGVTYKELKTIANLEAKRNA